MTIATVDEMATKIAELEAKLAAEREKSAYWREFGETMRLRAQSLAQELDQVR